MIYIVLFLLLLSGWQAFMKGSMSQLISGVSLLLALVVLIVGLVIGKIEVSTVYFAMFILTSIFILMQIYRLSTYHKYFLKMLPILIGYGILNGFLLLIFNFSNYFAWFIILIIGFLIMTLYKEYQVMDFSKLVKNKEQEKLLNESLKNTIKFYILSSLVYIVSIVGAFFYFTI